MTQIGQVRSVFAGEVELGAANKLHFRRQDLGDWTTADSDAATGVVHEFFDNISDLFSATVSIQVDQNVLVLNQATGAIEAEVPASGPEDPVTGSGTGDVVMGVGFRVNLLTGAILRGRRVHGAMMLVPTSRSAFDGSGVPGATSVALVLGAVTTLRAHANDNSLDLVVWARPSVPLGHVGTCFPTTNQNIGPFAAVLRARR